tara:strand:+ start:196 stop:630 length:435 start_codon:yes stop_codon:yes gene_type:complete
MGRPSKLTPEVADAVVEALEMGASQSEAAASVGVGLSTLEEWLSRGRGRNSRRSSRGVYATFAGRCERALPSGTVKLLKCVTAAGGKDWKAAAHLLACREPDRFSPKRRLEHAGEVKVDFIANLANLTPEQLAALAGDQDDDVE